MKYLSLLLVASLSLASCSLPWQKDTSSVTEKTDSLTTKTDSVVKEGDSVSINYVGKFEDGTVFDTSLADVAKQAGKFTEGREYSPLSFIAKDGGGVITGMWKGVIGMKVGEKKTLTISPKDAYGEKDDIQERVVKSEIFGKTLSRTIPRSETEDIVRTTIDKALLGDEKGIIVGKTITAGDGTTAKIEAISGSGVTLAIDNSKNPFHGKKIAVGTEVILGKNPAKITKVTSTDIILEITNSDNPFYGKTLAVGLSGEIQGKKLRVSKIEWDMVTVQISSENTHPLAGKTLIFEVELVSINPAK